jgi:predicted GH43/DUF377 family glycosyl hydrolase
MTSISRTSFAIVRTRRETPDELHGIVNNVVFPTGIDVVGDRIFDIYYGMADARIGCATMTLQAVAATAEAAA